MLGLAAAILLPSVVAFAGSFSSTYWMTGGLFTRYFSVSSSATVTVKTYPTQGVNGQTMTIYLENANGNVEDSSWNYSYVNDSCTLDPTTSGNHRLYLRNFTGQVMSGSIVVSY
ncbi:hypothetical protein P6P90_16100 [Ectobacillus antri]|jgi:hypothetical protein|uniref:Uncharacterized protein n=2 Tax=Ectobacillus antri TaxID=2486280 RepID=A0ABT6H832_9BACI|nr:hypothetical protein [Ectobacillus antri]MDG4658439.1 hypothetical protein [Ectobacillus antri]MDG5755424.1 hypothetical protein [Ectobacillus antri]